MSEPEPAKRDAGPLLAGIVNAPQTPFERYEWFVRAMGNVAHRDFPLATAILALSENPDVIFAQALARRPELMSAVVQASAFMAGRSDVIEREIGRADSSKLTPESLDVLARRRMADGDLAGGAECYRRIEAALSPSYYAASRLGAIHFSFGHSAEADRDYDRFRLHIVERDPKAFDPFLAAAREFSRSVESGAEGFATNESYWADKEQVRSLIASYELELIGGSPYRTPGRQINHAAGTRIGELAASDESVTAVVNFGSFCGAVDRERAERYPTLRWIGCDRETIAIEYSRERFRRDNLQFVTGDIGEVLGRVGSETRQGQVVMTHARSTCEMTPAKVAELYRTAARCGIGWIVGAEYIGVDVLAGRYFDPDRDGGRSSAVTRQVVNHDYRRILADAGYEIVRMQDEPIIAFYAPFSLVSIAFYTASVIRSFAARRVR